MVQESCVYTRINTVLTRRIEVDFFSLSHSWTPTVAFNNSAVLNHSLHQRSPECHSPLWWHHKQHLCARTVSHQDTMLPHPQVDKKMKILVCKCVWIHPHSDGEGPPPQQRCPSVVVGASLKLPFFHRLFREPRALTQHMHDSPACLIPARLHSALSRS